MKNFLFVFLLIVGYYNTKAQKTLEISLINRTLVSTDSILPFWFIANQYGKIKDVGSLLNLTDLDLEQLYHQNTDIFDYTWGFNALAGFGEKSYYQLNQAYGGMTWKGWEFKAGKFHDLNRYAGLSSTNGNLARSQNLRPYPKVRFGNLNFMTLPLLQNWLSYKAEYSEGLLNDARYVQNTRLHQKSFYLRAHLTATLDIEAGLEHYVLWGGTSPEEAIGKMPTGIKDYLRYISGSSGDKAFPETDQRNVVGNQLGSWQFQVQKRFPEMYISFYLSHLFEELSGLKWRNWPDNLLGVYIHFKDKERLINDVVYEYTNTRQQSILDREDDPDPGNYFRHGIYRSSFTYHQQMMGSPLFFPVIVHEGIARGLGSNRFYAHHLGVKGKVTNQLEWKGLLTFIHHFGLYNAPYDPSQRQLSGHLEAMYTNSGLPADIGLSIAADARKTAPNNAGIQLTISRIF